MKDLDLRQVGKLLGFPLYIDVASEHRLITREKKVVLAQKILEKLFELPKKRDPEAQLPGQTNIIDELEKQNGR